MRVLILANDYTTIANFRTELLRELINREFEVCLSLPTDSRNQLFRDLGCNVIENNMTRYGTNPLSELKVIKEYTSLIGEVKPDVILTYTVKPNIYGSIAANKCKVPVINNVTGIGITMQQSGIKQKFMLTLMKYGMKHSDVVFFQNQGNMDMLTAKGIKGNETVLLPGSGVNLEKHCYVPYPDERDKVKFITVSRLRQDKGYDELFSAIEQFAGRSDLEFHIVGWSEDETYLSSVQTLTERLPVIFHGEKTQTEVHELISQCHCLIHPSHHEGMSNVMMEASSAGRPCIASDIFGCREIVTLGETGYTFPVKNADGLVLCINKILSHTPEERKLMGLNARKKMEQEFDRQLVIGTYIKYINKITNRLRSN